MRFFKYLIFLLSIFISVFSFAAIQYTTGINSGVTPGTGSTPEASCQSYVQNYNEHYSQRGSPQRAQYVSVTNNKCNIKWALNPPVTGFIQSSSRDIVSSHVPDPECFHPDYKIVTQSITGQIKKSICIPNNGVMCKYTSSTINNAPIVNGSITTTFSSVSKSPDPDCQEDLANPPCDPKDPYGGCYSPPNQECTRQFDGSIVCPEDKEPPIEKGCNGADYCKRPPQGCGEGYVSGTWNGERICIKTKPSDPNAGDGSGGDGSGGDGSGGDGSGGDGSGGDGSGGDGSGGDGSGGDGSGGGSGGDGSGGGSPELPVTPDLTGVINAIKNVASKIDHYSKEIIESIDSMSKKLGGKIDESNVHLDQIEANTLAIKNNTQTTNDLLQQINDKIGSDSGSDNPPSGDGVDLTETNGLLGEIRDGINDIKNVFSDEGKEDLEKIGQPSDDPRYINAQNNAQSSINALANKLTFGSSACLSDFQIQLPIFGPVNIALSQWCGLLALVKILFQLVVLLTCLRMLDATVRTI